VPKADLIRRLRDEDGLICHIISTIDDDVLAAAPGLKVVSNVAVGYNWRNPRSTRGCCRCAT